MDSAFNWVINNDGLATESEYPYNSGTGVTGKCAAAKKLKFKDVRISAVCDVKEKDEGDLEKAVTQQVRAPALEHARARAPRCECARARLDFPPRVLPRVATTHPSPPRRRHPR
jgi:hypothetical protein